LTLCFFADQAAAVRSDAERRKAAASSKVANKPDAVALKMRQLEARLKVGWAYTVFSNAST